MVAFPFLCLFLRLFLCFLPPGRVQIAEGFALLVASCVLKRQLSKKSKFCFVMGTRKGLRREAVGTLSTTETALLQREELSSLPVWQERSLS